MAMNRNYARIIPLNSVISGGGALYSFVNSMLTVQCCEKATVHSIATTLHFRGSVLDKKKSRTRHVLTGRKNFISVLD